jgi:hypothetical protein
VTRQTGTATPSQADRIRPPSRFRGLPAREIWGYGVWLFAGLVFGVPESWAGLATPPWPSLSDTVIQLERLWHPVAVIIVALIVFVVFQAVKYPPAHTGEVQGPGASHGAAGPRAAG